MIRDERRKTKDERYRNRSQLQESGTENCMAQKIVFLILLLAVCAFASPKAKTASAYYGDAAYLYFQNRLPSAEIACDEGLEKYPNDSKLQNLKARIQEAKDEQQKQNEQNNPNGQNNQDQNKDQNKDENQDKNNQDKQDENQQNKGDSSSSGSDENQQDQGQNGESSSSSEGGENQQNQNGSGESSSSDMSSSSNGEGENQEQGGQENQQENADEPRDPEDPNAMSREQASQLLKDFDEQNGERKPWKPARGQVYPEKDW